MLITVTDLRDKHACIDGIEAFAAFTTCMGGVLDVPEWTYRHQMMALASPMREWLGWAWLNRMLPQWSMAGASLRRADLRGAGLRGADLSRADLRRADLRGADLTEADLRGADLRRADLRGTDLRGADLREADLCGADLRRTIYSTGTQWPARFDPRAAWAMLVDDDCDDGEVGE